MLTIIHSLTQVELSQFSQLHLEMYFNSLLEAGSRKGVEINGTGYTSFLKCYGNLCCISVTSHTLYN